MAEIFKDKGYSTSAFVATYVLDSKWGLNQGFDTYFDNFDLSKFERISLGTVQDSSKLTGQKLANPREKIKVFNELSRAQEIGMSGRAAEAIKIIDGIIASDPDITDAYFTLGNLYFKQRKFEEAVNLVKKGLDLKPGPAELPLGYFLLADLYGRLGDRRQSEEYVRKGRKNANSK